MEVLWATLEQSHGEGGNSQDWRGTEEKKNNYGSAVTVKREEERRSSVCAFTTWPGEETRVSSFKLLILLV